MDPQAQDVLVDACYIRLATEADAGRIAEIHVFNNRINFFPIFGDEDYSFNVLNVERLARELRKDTARLAQHWVYDDGVLRGFVRVDVDAREVVMLYVDPCFQSRGYGAALLAYAVERLGARGLWVLEKNDRGRRFYERNGFANTGRWKYEEDTTEHLLWYECEG